MCQKKKTSNNQKRSNDFWKTLSTDITKIDQHNRFSHTFFIMSLPTNRLFYHFAQMVSPQNDKFKIHSQQWNVLMEKGVLSRSFCVIPRYETLFIFNKALIDVLIFKISENWVITFHEKFSLEWRTHEEQLFKLNMTVALFILLPWANLYQVLY